MDNSDDHQQGKLGHQWEAGTVCQAATHQPYSVVIWCNSMVNRQPQIMKLTNHMFPSFSFLKHSSLLHHAQSCPLSSWLTVSHWQCPISSGCSAGCRFGLWDVTVTCRAVCCRASLPCKPTTYLPVAGRKSPLPTPSSSCLIYTEPAQGERSSETIFEFRGLVGN